MSDFDFSECTIANHHWQRASRKIEAGGNVVVEWHCPNCTKRKVVRYNLRGTIMSQRYYNPEGYVKPGRGEALSRAEWRALYLKNLRRRRKS